MRAKERATKSVKIEKVDGRNGRECSLFRQTASDVRAGVVPRIVMWRCGASGMCGVYVLLYKYNG